MGETPTTGLPSGSTARNTYRRPYKKSTTGCHACKARKIKCDEARPICGNCKRRYIDTSSCHYDGQAKPLGRRASNVPVLESAISVRPVSLDPSNLMALRLMHHYTQTTSLGLLLPGATSPSPSPSPSPSSPSSSSAISVARSASPLAYSLWGVQIPRMAFTSETVLNALLGISAWHLSTLNPNDPTLAIASRSYFGKAMKIQRNAVRAADRHDHPEVLEPLIVTGAILAHHHWLLDNGSEQQIDGYSFGLGTFALCNGVRFLAAKQPSLLPNIYQSFEAEAASPVPDETTPDPPGEFMRRARLDADRLREHIRHAKPYTADDQEVYLKIIKDILRVSALVASETWDDISLLEYRILNIVHRAPLRFVALLERRDPVSMGLFARKTALLELLRNHSSSWWIHGVGRERIHWNTLSNVQRVMPAKFDWLLEWPRSIIFGDVTLASVTGTVDETAARPKI